MSRKITSIIWITKNIPDRLIETIEEYTRVNKENNMDWNLLISSNSRKEIPGVNYIDKDEIYKKIQVNTKQNIPEDVIEFALYSKYFLDKIDTIDTGTHRNAALLATIGQKIIFADDDVLCKFHEIKNNHRKLKLDIGDTKVFHFENKNILDLAVAYSEKSNLAEIVTSHQKLLSSTTTDSDVKVLATMTGVHGESISDTPNYLLHKIQNKNNENLYLSAKRNKLILSYSENYLVRKKPYFVGMFAGLNNEEIIPPFLPITRNSDGVFAAAMMACVPTGMIGQVPWVAKHEHFPPREYGENAISNYQFRLHGLIVALLNYYTQTNYTKKLDINKTRFKEVGEFLENFSKKSNDDFIKFMRNFVSTNIDRMTLELGRFLVSNPSYSKEWQKDIKKYLIDAQKYKKTEQFGIPQELVDGRRDLKENIELTKHLVGIYGKLLSYWPDIIESMKNSNNY